jgi:predicted DNA-binding transcriptional regulator AlpA
MERHMKAKLATLAPEAALAPDQIVRWREGKKYFGYGHTQLVEKIAAGEIPAPLNLSDTGRAKGWLGSDIIAHQQRLLAKRGG